ncbi:MAG: hypothetical protein FD177_728 [Desulfovibrionaceae bacterium]|nr:MAG: hypothetical protein FD177_728 [Desulfovibrionaceae bacterium]
MSSGKPDIRVFGQVSMADAGALARLAGTLPDDVTSLSGSSMEIEFAGFYLDVDVFLETAASSMRAGDSGHLDVFDDENGVLTRYDLAPGGHESKSHRYDDILEHTKGDGNW